MLMRRRWGWWAPEPGRQGDVPRVGMWRAMGERYELELSDRVGWGDLPVAGVGETD